MDPLKIEEMLESFDNELKEKDQNDPWLVYISDKGKNSCFKCTKNHGKRFRESDLSKPALPIHPNCRCKYEKLNNQTARKVIMRSATVRADDSPGLGGIRVSNINDMLDKLEKEYASGTISELIISNHGEFPGEFEIGGKADRLDLMSSTQIERLKKLGLHGNLWVNQREIHQNPSSVKRQSGITAPVGRFYSVCRLTAART